MASFDFEDERMHLPLHRYLVQMAAFSALAAAALIAICLYVPGWMAHNFIVDYVEARAVEWFDELNEQEILTREHMQARNIPDIFFEPLMSFTRGSGQYRMVVYDENGRPFWTSSALERTELLAFDIVEARDELFGAFTQLKQVLPSKIEHFHGYSKRTELRDATGGPELVADVIFTVIFAGQTEGYVSVSYHIEEEHNEFLQNIRLTFFGSSLVVYGLLNLSLLLGFYFVRRHKRAALREQRYQRLVEAERARQHKDIEMLAEFSGWLHCSNSSGELFDMVRAYIVTLFPETQGALYVADPDNKQFHLACAWGQSPSGESFHAHDCWALRQGRLFRHDESKVSFPCHHIGEVDAPSLCLPLLAQGETIGLLTIQARDADASEAPVAEGQMRLLLMISEQMSMAIANARLRDQLIRQSNVDPLTGLHNRRYLGQEFLKLMQNAASRGQRPGVVCFDIDHFKSFNDQFGHDAGDKVLQEIANVMMQQFLGEALLIRLGGEEFAMIFESCDERALADHAEQLRRAVEEMRIVFGGQALPKVTISLGCAIFPDNGTDKEALLTSADLALYQAKDGGRNQVITAYALANMGAAGAEAQEDVDPSS